MRTGQLRRASQPRIHLCKAQLRKEGRIWRWISNLSNAPWRVLELPHLSCSNPLIHHNITDSDSWQQMNDSCMWKDCMFCDQSDACLTVEHHPMWSQSHILSACSHACMCVQLGLAESNTNFTNHIAEKNC
jgi:hypothetical protein